MATTLQLRRGTAAEAAALIGSEGELFIDTENNAIHILDGINAGGTVINPSDYATLSYVSNNAVKFYAQSTAPVAADNVNDGDFWRDTDDGIVYIATVTPSSVEWFEV